MSRRPLIQPRPLWRRQLVERKLQNHQLSLGFDGPPVGLAGWPNLAVPTPKGGGGILFGGDQAPNRSRMPFGARIFPELRIRFLRKTNKTPSSVMVPMLRSILKLATDAGTTTNSPRISAPKTTAMAPS